MNTEHHDMQPLFLMICLLGFAHIAYASDGSDAIELPEVAVTATRTKASLSDAPAAVTVVNAKKIAEKNASRLGDVLDQVPSLYLRGGALGQSQGTIGTSGMSLRGIDQTRTLVLLDGQPIQDASSGKVNWRVPFVEDIARVEVVPGAFSSLYGSNAIGGVINIISKQPNKREFTAKIKKGWSDASGEDASLYFRDKTDSGLGFVGGLGYQNRDSYVNDFVVKVPLPGIAGTPVTGALPITTREGVPAYLIGDMGATPWNATNATAKLFYDLNSRDKIYSGVNYQETRVNYTQFNTYLRNAATGAPISGGTLLIDGKNILLSNYDWTLFSFLPLREATTRYFAGFDGAIGNDYLLKVDLAKIERQYGFSLASPAASWNSGPGTLSDTPNDSLDGTVQLSFPAGANHFVVTGLALHKDSVNQRIYALSDWRAPNSITAVNSGYHANSTTASVFAQDEFNAMDKLKIYLGGRWDSWQAQGDNFITAPTAATLYPTRSASAFSPKLSALYKPTEMTVLRASFGKSFRAPTNQDMFTSSTSRGRTTAGDPNLQPEHGVTWELGGEFSLTENTRATVTYYDTQLTNLIYLMQVSASNSLRINAGKARVNGIELGAKTKLANWLELDANYAFIESRVLENAADPLSVGKRLTDSPRNIVGIGLTAQQGAWSGTLNARYVSHIFWNAQNTDVVEGVPGSYDAHSMVNAKLGYAFSKTIKGALAVNNLLNTRVYSYFLLPGRNMTAEMNFSF